MVEKICGKGEFRAWTAWTAELQLLLDVDNTVQQRGTGMYASPPIVDVIIMH